MSLPLLLFYFFFFVPFKDLFLGFLRESKNQSRLLVLPILAHFLPLLVLLVLPCPWASRRKTSSPVNFSILVTNSWVSEKAVREKEGCFTNLSNWGEKKPSTKIFSYNFLFVYVQLQATFAPLSCCALMLAGWQGCSVAPLLILAGKRKYNERLLGWGKNRERSLLGYPSWPKQTWLGK